MAKLAIHLLVGLLIGRKFLTDAFLVARKNSNNSKFLTPRSLAIGPSTSGLNIYKRFLNIQAEEEGPSFSREDVDLLRQHVLQPSAIFDKIVDKKASIVLIGEGSHGTQECYEFRADLTRQLIENGKCNGVLIEGLSSSLFPPSSPFFTPFSNYFLFFQSEGDFPDTAVLHFYVTGLGGSKTLMQCLENYERFPSWMWGNTVIRDFAEWLRNWNMKRPPHERCGIFGLDLYSLHLSIDNVLEYLAARDPEMCTQVRRDYAGFERLEPQTYGMLVERGLIKGCEKACVDALQKIAAKTEIFEKEDPQNGLIAADAAFFNEMNARVVVDAEHYYRAMFSSENSWNIRDTHFFDTMERVIAHLKSSRGGDSGKVVLWAHNSHLGDARFTHLEEGTLKIPRRSQTKDLNIGR